MWAKLSHLCLQVENEWRTFVALKQDVAVMVLSRRLGKQAAQAKVESTLAAEQQSQDELIKLRLKHIKLRIKIHRLEAELRDGEEHARDPLHLQFEQLQAERLELKKHTEKQNEESLKMQKKISCSLEVGQSHFCSCFSNFQSISCRVSIVFSSALTAPVKHKGEAVLEPDGGPGQATAAGRGGGHGGQEEGAPDQD